MERTPSTSFVETLMSDLAFFAQLMFSEGRLRVRGLPISPADRDALPVLRKAYAIHTLAVAGATLPFSETIALAACNLVHHAAWNLLNPPVSIENARGVLRMPVEPDEPAHHLSADLVLRYLPALHRRARAARAGEALAAALALVLRSWPLSGVLSDLPDAPLTTLDFRHSGLQLLYAERLAEHERPGWFPVGAGLPEVELVWQAQGRATVLLPRLQGIAQSLAERDRQEAS